MLLTLNLKPSYRLLAILIVAHAGAWAAGYAATGDQAARLALTAGVAASFYACARRSALLAARHAIVALQWREGEDIEFQTRDGRWHSARLLPTSFVSTPLTVLNLRTSGSLRARHVVLLPDSLGAEDYRRLRVRLQWGRAGLA